MGETMRTLPVLTSHLTYFGQPVVVRCDAKCHKAWGINGRPSVQLGADVDDYAWLADDELGTAPVDPGTYEGGHAKPLAPPAVHNKWCVRECERSTMTDPGEPYDPPDFSRREPNMPHLHPDHA